MKVLQNLCAAAHRSSLEVQRLQQYFNNSSLLALAGKLRSSSSAAAWFGERPLCHGPNRASLWQLQKQTRPRETNKVASLNKRRRSAPPVAYLRICSLRRCRRRHHSPLLSPSLLCPSRCCDSDTRPPPLLCAIKAATGMAIHPPPYPTQSCTVHTAARGPDSGAFIM